MQQRVRQYVKERIGRCRLLNADCTCWPPWTTSLSICPRHTSAEDSSISSLKKALGSFLLSCHRRLSKLRRRARKGLAQVSPPGRQWNRETVARQSTEQMQRKNGKALVQEKGKGRLLLLLLLLLPIESRLEVRGQVGVRLPKESVAWILLFPLGESICAPCILFWLPTTTSQRKLEVSLSVCRQVTGAQSLVKGEKGHLAAEDVLYLTRYKRNESTRRL